MPAPVFLWGSHGKHSIYAWGVQRIAVRERYVRNIHDQHLTRQPIGAGKPPMNLAERVHRLADPPTTRGESLKILAMCPQRVHAQVLEFVGPNL